MHHDERFINATHVEDASNLGLEEYVIIFEGMKMVVRQDLIQLKRMCHIIVTLFLA